MTAGGGIAGHENWNRRVFVLAVPIILANLAQPVLALVDTMVAGHLDGPHHLGGVALGGVLFSFLFWGFGFLRMATTGLVAQAFGAGDAGLLQRHVLRALLVGGGCGLLIVMLQWPLIKACMTLLGGSAAVQESAVAFASARIWSAPAALGNFVILGYLLGTQRVLVSLALQFGMNLLNLAATLILAVGLGWGVAGIGAGTAFAEWVALGVGLAYVKPFARADGAVWRDVLLASALWQLFAVNRDIFLRSFCLLVAFGWFARAGAAEGDAVLAANAVLLNLHGFMAYGLDGFAHATETLVGSVIGARNRAALGKIIKAATLWSAAISALFSLAYAFGGNAIVSVLTDQTEVRATAAEFMPYVAALPVVSFAGFILDGIFIGALKTRELRNSMFISTLFFLGAAYVLQGYWNNHGLWTAMLVLMIARAVTLGAYLRPALWPSAAAA
ncbi:MAG: dinF [Rhizobiaceae bacterium]|nr:dinF [Rhizobiaceae bacterium]